MYGSKCLGYNQIKDSIKLEVKDGFLYKKGKPLDVKSFLDLRIVNAWDFISKNPFSNGFLYATKDDIYSFNIKGASIIPGIKYFKYSKKHIENYDKVFSLSQNKYLKVKEHNREYREKDLKRLVVESFLSNFEDIKDRYIEEISRESRKLEDYLELFEFNNLSFLDTDIFNFDFAVKFDVERKDSLKHFLYMCFNLTKNQKFNEELRLYLESSRDSFKYFEQRNSSRTNI